MMFALFCLYIVSIVLPADAKSLPEKHVDFAVFQKNLHSAHLGFQKSAKANGYLLTETHFETKVKTICTHSGCSSSAEEKNEDNRGCPKGWNKFAGNCYKLLSDKRNWDSAKSACKALGANLADITKSENLWLYGTFTGLKHNTWIGATDQSKEGEWRWFSSGKLLSYYAWKKGEPNNAGGNEDCVETYKHSGRLVWNDEACTTKRQSLCKKRT